MSLAGSAAGGNATREERLKWILLDLDRRAGTADENLFRHSIERTYRVSPRTANEYLTSLKDRGDVVCQYGILQLTAKGYDRVADLTASDYASSSTGDRGARSDSGSDPGHETSGSPGPRQEQLVDGQRGPDLVT
jgi:hypothetical protein